MISEWYILLYCCFINIFHDILGIVTASLIQPMQFAEAYRNRICALFRQDMAAHGDRPPVSLIRAPAPSRPVRTLPSLRTRPTRYGIVSGMTGLLPLLS